MKFLFIFQKAASNKAFTRATSFKGTEIVETRLVALKNGCLSVQQNKYWTVLSFKYLNIYIYRWIESSPNLILCNKLPVPIISPAAAVEFEKNFFRRVNRNFRFYKYQVTLALLKLLSF